MFFPIIGADYLENFNLVVDLRKMRLVAGDGSVLSLSTPPAGSTFASIGVRPARPDVQIAAVCAESPSEYKQLLQSFPAVLNPSKRLPEVIHKVQHHI